jgi:Flp pilus assembly protein TadB
MGLFLWFNNRDYLQPLLDATMGRVAIVAGVVLMLAGILWLRKIVNIEV